MDLDQALRDYRLHRFTDDDVTRCTGLSVRAWRELIKTGAVRTVIERRGPGRVRLCDATVLKRAAVIAALNRAGLSLAVAGQIALFLPYRTLLYAVCDPSTILLERAEADDSKETLSRRDRPRTDWFDPDKPAIAEPMADWSIKIYDGRFVGAVYKLEGEPVIVGELRADRTRFTVWLPLHRRRPLLGSAIEQLARDLLSDRFVESWETPNPKELSRLGYQYEKHAGENDPLRLAAAATVRSPLFCSKVNVGLAIRKALRRYLYLEPPALTM
jgi:hypothetical protein